MKKNSAYLLLIAALVVFAFVGWVVFQPTKRFHKIVTYLTVLGIVGWALMAIFGAPIAHEDHPQRALYAALRLQDEMKRYAERLRAEKGLTLLARVGVNTGAVVVRTLQTDEKHTEYVPIGHSTSLAARLQALAAPGSIAISEALRKFVEGYFTLKALGLDPLDGLLPVADGDHLDVLVGERQLDNTLNRDAVVGEQEFVWHPNPL